MAVEIFNDIEQGSPEWHMLRLGIPTASNFAHILAKGQGKTRRTYLMKCLAERFTGEPADSYTNLHMERGKEMEAEARDLYAMVHHQAPIKVGFVRNGGIGCSPDSLIGEDGLLEIKTKLGHLQLEAVLAKRVPPEHVAQVQGQLWVAERQWCDFVSYWPKLPLLRVRVERDEHYIKELSVAVMDFAAELDELTQQIKDMGAQTYAEAMAVPDMVMEI